MTTNEKNLLSEDSIYKKCINEFRKAELKIISIEKLQDYVLFCIDNNEHGYNDKKEINHHHILPQAESCFPQFSKLKNNPWNGTYLSKENHIKAHTILNEAIYNESMIYAEDMMKKIAGMDFKDIYWLRKKQAKNTVIIKGGVNKCIPIEDYNRETMTHVNKNKATVKTENGFTQKDCKELDGSEIFTRTNMTNITVNGKSIMIPLDEYDKEIHTHTNKGKTILFDTLDNKWVSVDLSKEKDKSRYKNTLSEGTLVKTKDGLKRVTIQEYEKGEFEHFRKNTVAVKGKGLISKEEYEKGGYKTASSDKVFVIFEDGTKGSVSAEEYAKNKHKYRQVSKVLFKIWDNSDNKIYEGYGRDELIGFCKQNNIPVSPIIVSYTNGGEALNLIKRYARFNGFVCKKIKS